MTGNLPILLGNTSVESELLTIKTSAEHSQIIISGNAELDAFCSGNGTTGMSWETAHIIGNFTIDTFNEQESCFSIKNTDRYLILRNISLRTYPAYLLSGLLLDNVSHVRVENITIIDGVYGINLHNVQNCSVINSSLSAYSYGLYATYTSNIHIEQTIADNFDNQRGFYFLSGTNITLESCSIYSSREGITFVNSHQFSIQNCIFWKKLNSIIDISGGTAGNIVNNTLESSLFSNSRLIIIEDHSNFVINSNNFTASPMDTVYIATSDNGQINANNFSSQGILFGIMNRNFSIPQNNLIDGKPIKYYENLTGLNEVGGLFGQIIINNVNNSIFSHYQVQNTGYTGIQLVDSFNVTFDQCFTNGSSNSGFSIYNSENFIIQNSTILGSPNGIIIKESHLSLILNCTIQALSEQSGYGLYALIFSNLTLRYNRFSNVLTGIYLRNTENVSGYFNTFIHCTFDFSSTTNIIFDDTNTRDGKPMYYFYGVSNKIISLREIGELYITHCEHFLILDAVFEGTNNGIQVYDSIDIAFFNVSVSNSTNYLMQAGNILNLTLMNSSFFYSADSGLNFWNITNLIIQNCVFSNISSYPLSFSEVTNVTFTNNWIVNFSNPIYLEDFENVSIANNCYVNNESVWLEIYYNTGNETIVISNNLNQSYFDPNYFPQVSMEDLMNYWNRTASTSSGNTNSNPDSSSNTTNTNTTTSQTDTTDSVTPPSNDDDLDLGQLWQILAIIAGAAISISLFVMIIIRMRRKQHQSKISSYSGKP
ncbi:right-handed parallel beta-helix repeat-containing protein [Candidatus Harpocratesius sp.]